MNKPTPGMCFDLVEACKPVLLELKRVIEADGGCNHDIGSCWCDVYPMIEALEKAIAKAEGLEVEHE